MLSATILKEVKRIALRLLPTKEDDWRHVSSLLLAKV